MTRPNLLVILIDDLRFDEFGAGGHPYMLTPHVDRLAREDLASGGIVVAFGAGGL